mgnify:CR=1 FL=1|tara:strand:- start:5247 stop:5615 length:369 start_codon:yes stop_codon:yes gene_type:complete
MPMIQVRARAGVVEKPIHLLLANVSRVFAERADVALADVCIEWQTLPQGHCVVGGESHAPPYALLVSLMTPDSYGEARIATLLETLAVALADNAGLLPEQIFISHLPVASGHVWDQGQVVRW